MIRSLKSTFRSGISDFGFREFSTWYQKLLLAQIS